MDDLRKCLRALKHTPKQAQQPWFDLLIYLVLNDLQPPANSRTNNNKPEESPEKPEAGSAGSAGNERQPGDSRPDTREGGSKERPAEPRESTINSLTHKDEATPRPEEQLTGGGEQTSSPGGSRFASSYSLLPDADPGRHSADLPAATEVQSLPGQESREVFSCLSQCLLDDVQLICSTQSTECPPHALLGYLNHERGWRLLAALRLLPHVESQFCHELAVLLLSLYTLLSHQDIEEEDAAAEEASYASVLQTFYPKFYDTEVKLSTKKKLDKKHKKRRGQAKKSSLFRGGFPDLGKNALLEGGSRTVENLAEFEQSNSESEYSDRLVKTKPACMTNVGISKDDFYYYNVKGAASDDTGCAGGDNSSLPRQGDLFPPPDDQNFRVPFLTLRCLLLDLANKLARGLGHDTSQHGLVVQLIMTSAQQLSVCREGHNLVRALLVKLILTCLKSLRFRPDVVQFVAANEIHTTVASVIYKPQGFPVPVWADLVKECIAIFLQLHEIDNLGSKVYGGMKNSFASLLATNIGSDPSVVGSKVLVDIMESTICVIGAVVATHRDEMCEHIAMQIVDVLLTAVTRTCSEDPERWCQLVNSVVSLLLTRLNDDCLIELFQKIAFVVSDLKGSALNVGLFLQHFDTVQRVSAPAVDSYFKMLEHIGSTNTVAENEKRPARSCSSDERADLLSQPPVVHDRDSVLGTSSEFSSSTECLAQSSQQSELELSCYLNLMLTGDGRVKETTCQHLRRSLAWMSAEQRYRLATQVVLPFLQQELLPVEQTCLLDNTLLDKRLVDSEPEKHPEVKNVDTEPDPAARTDLLVMMMDLLSCLSVDQLVAMALIRDQKVWSKIKQLATSAGPSVSFPAQHLIKTLVLHAHTFRGIRLSEAEAMALLDDETDRINFEERDKNAQYWLFKQLYHVLVQSSMAVLHDNWRTDADGVQQVSSTWTVCIELVQKVPEFFSFSIGRGILEINKQLLDNLIFRLRSRTDDGVATLLSHLINFFAFVVKHYDESKEEFLHLDLKVLTEDLARFLSKVEGRLPTQSICFNRVILSGVLEASVKADNEQGQLHHHAAGEFSPSQATSQDSGGSGYDADDSDSEMEDKDKARAVPVPSIVLKPCFNFFVNSYLALLHSTARQGCEEYVYSLEYLTLKLHTVCGTNTSNILLLNDRDVLAQLLAAVKDLAVSISRDVENLGALVVKLVRQVSTVRLTPATIQQLFGFVTRNQTLSRQFLTLLCSMVSTSRLEWAGVAVARARSRNLSMSSVASRDSGLDSTCSGRTGPSPPVPAAPFKTVLDSPPGAEPPADFALVFRVKIMQGTLEENNEWMQLISIDFPNETVGLYLNLMKGLKLSICGSRGGTFAAAETAVKNMFRPGEWVHLVFNLVTTTEANSNRPTKTLSAFVNCCRVWDVALCTQPAKSSARSGPQAVLTLGWPEMTLDLTSSYLIFGHVHMLEGTSFSVEDAVLNYLLGPVDLNCKNYTPKDINLRPLLERLPETLSHCIDILHSQDFLGRHQKLSDRVMAHFSPRYLWSAESSTEDYLEAHHYQDTWTPCQGVMEVGGLPSLLLLPAAALEHSMDEEVVAKSLESIINVVTSGQELYEEFVELGGFPLISSLLSVPAFKCGPLILCAILNGCCSKKIVYMAEGRPTVNEKVTDQLLIQPQLFSELIINWRLWDMESKSSLGIILKCLAHLVSEANPGHEFNLKIVSNSNLVQMLLSCLQDLIESANADYEDPPMSEINQTLSSIPPDPIVACSLLKLAMQILPPTYLYMPDRQPPLFLCDKTHRTNSSSLVTQLHTYDVIDVSQLLGQMEENEVAAQDESVKHQKFLKNKKIQEMDRLNESDGLSVHEEAVSHNNLSDIGPVGEEFNLEFLEQEEDRVSEWEVVTPSHNTPLSSAGSPVTTPTYSPILASILNTAVTNFTLFPDSVSASLANKEFRPSLLLSFANHPSPDVHSAGIALIGLVLQRCSNTGKNLFKREGGYQQLASIIQQHSPSPQLAEAILTLLHGHPVSIEIPYEFSDACRPSLQLWSVPAVLPLLTTSMSDAGLAHKYVLHIHELCANVPSFLNSLLSEGFVKSLLTGLITIYTSKDLQVEEDGFANTPRLQDDFHNVLRMLIVQFVDRPGVDYDTCLDLLFLSAALSESSFNNDRRPCISQKGCDGLRVTTCLLLEEALYSLQTALAPDEADTGKVAANTKSFLMGEMKSSVSVTSGVDATQSSLRTNRHPTASARVLASRRGQIIRFAVNFLTTSKSSQSKESPEETSLIKSLTSVLLPGLLSGTNQKKRNSNNVTTEDGSLLGVLVVHQLDRKRPLDLKVDLVRKLDSASDLGRLTRSLFGNADHLEVFRQGVSALATDAKPLSSVDSDMLTSFYSRLTDRSIFPKGPQPTANNREVAHPSLGPWQAECCRCLTLAITKEEEVTRTAEMTSSSLTEKLVEKHDNCRKEQLESKRLRLCTSHSARSSWREIVTSQTQPGAVWHRPDTLAQSLVVDNVTGTSGMYSRLVRRHSLITEERFYRPSHSQKAKPPVVHFQKLCHTEEEREDGSLGLAERVGVELVQGVELAELVTATDCQPGELVLANDSLHYLADSVSWAVELSSVEAVSKRRFQLKDTALELFVSTGEVHMLTFRGPAPRDRVLTWLTANCPTLLKPGPSLSSTTKLWQQGVLTNFQYLTELNRLAGRTPNDLMQYPVFPWILSEYDSEHLDLRKPDIYRDLRKPIAVQHEECSKRYTETYKLLEQEGIGAYHFASHYSNAGIVLHFMVRLPPFTSEFIKFQDGNFDLADRSFFSLSTSWLMASRVSSSDVKELIPQLFYMPELLLNTEGLALGVRQNGVEVSDVELPRWAPDARIFTRIHRQALESPHVRRELSHWIDLVFGHKQTGPAAVESVNVFHPATYASCNLDDIADPLERQARQTMIATYGQTPLQLFTTPHPSSQCELTTQEKETEQKVLPNVSGLRWGHWVGAPGAGPAIVWQQCQAEPVSRLVSLESLEVVGLVGKTALVGRYSSDQMTSASLLGGSSLQGAGLVTWGHGDNTLHLHAGKQEAEVQLASLPSWDEVVTVSSHPRVSSLWLGHLSGMLTVFTLRQGGGGLQLSRPVRLYGHCGRISSVSLSPEFGVAVTCSEEGSTVTWDLHSRRLLHRCQAARGGPLLAVVNKSSGDIAVVTQAGLLSLYSINLSLVGSRQLEQRVTAIAWTRCQEGVAINAVAVGTAAGLVRIFSGWDLQHIRDVPGCPPAAVTDLCYSEDSSNLVVATADGTVTIMEKAGSRGINKTPRYSTIV